MKKHYDIARIQDELRQSVFFQRPEPVERSAEADEAKTDASARPVPPPAEQPTIHRPTKSQQARTHASELAGMLASNHASIIAAIRKTLKTVGKDVAYVRLTPGEKQQLADIVYTYRRQGLKTSENEISRVAVNFLVEDYHRNGRESVLAQVLAALQA